MALIDKLNDELKSSLKSGDAVRASVIRMLKADINNTAIRADKNALDESEVLKVVQKHVKQHIDSITQFEKGNRADLVAKEKDELKVLESYLPAQMPDADLEGVINSVLDEAGVTGIKDLGRVIKAALERVKGAADGKRVSECAGRLLKKRLG